MSERPNIKYHRDDDTIKYNALQGYPEKACIRRNMPGYKLVIGILSVIVIGQFAVILIIIRTQSNDCQQPLDNTDTKTRTPPPTVLSMQQIENESFVTKPEPINSLCFPCAEIGKNITKNDMGKMIKLDKKTNMCCMEDVGNLRKLFLLIINEYYRNVMDNSSTINQSTKGNNSANLEDTAVGPVAGHVGGTDHDSQPPSTHSIPPFWTKREVAAHMFLDNKLLKGSNDTAPRIPWNGHDYHNLSMMSHLLVYDPHKRSIQIKQYGLYFVYTSITFQAPQNDLNAQVYHMLLREHYLLPNTGATIMMMNKFGGGKQSSGFHTSFLCGVFKLRGDEEIFVKVSNVSFVYQFYYSNYLGLYRLSTI